ncbi:DUF6163 family protein [Aquamicrobium segne]|uniref:DUF6163 family protein n=1 Tax=Aquamicrobium segne TaxID=469547 RepID=A0ABW0GXJ8_9HYPH
MTEGLPTRAVFLPDRLDFSFAAFLRLVACLCLLQGIFYWVRLIGYYPGDLYRFDLMPIHWQIAAAALAVLFPFAAAGLWMLASWGPIIWLLCAAGEIIMYAGFPQYFGNKPVVIVSYALVAALYCAFRAALQIRQRRQAMQQARSAASDDALG